MLYSLRMTETNIGRRIADLREAAGLTQTELAKKLKTTQSAVARFESGSQNVSTDTLKKVSKALGRNLLTMSPGSLSLEINGGAPLVGTIETNTSKNGAVVLLCASLLNQGKTILKGMPRIEEVHRLIEVLESVGVGVSWQGSDVVISVPERLKLDEIDHVAAHKTRSIIMFIGSLMHRMSRFSLPQSGGCKLGSRTVRPHFFALEHFGVGIKTTETAFEVSVKESKDEEREVILYESGDTVTENALLAAALSPGVTTIKYATANYMVQELCAFLMKGGVVIEGVGTTTLKVTGVDEINADIQAYGKQYSQLLFLIYDIGTIRDEDEFKNDIDNADNIQLVIVKH